MAVELGLDEPNGAPIVFQQALDVYSPETGMDGKTNVLYKYLLDSCEKLFDAEMDQATFEEHMRWFFGTQVSGVLLECVVSLNRMQAFHTFTIDKVVAALIKQVSRLSLI